MDRNLLMTIVLLVLLVITVLQAVQLNGIRSNIESGSFTGNVAASSSSGSNDVVASKSLQNLPGMVGGC